MKDMKLSMRGIAKLTGAGLIAGGLLLGGPAGAAFADDAVSTAVGALGTTVDKAVVAGSLAGAQAVKAGGVATGTAVNATTNAVGSAIKGLLGH